MKHPVSLTTFLMLSATTFALSLPATAIAQPDAEAAQALAKKNDCLKCHAVDKTKKGPSYKKIAEKYKGKPDGEDKCIKAMTTGPKVKLEDGSEEEHKVINTKDQNEMKNLCSWILSR